MLVFIKTRELNLATYFVPIMGQHKRPLKDPQIVFGGSY